MSTHLYQTHDERKYKDHMAGTFLTFTISIVIHVFSMYAGASFIQTAPLSNIDILVHALLVCFILLYSAIFCKNISLLWLLSAAIGIVTSSILPDNFMSFNLFTVSFFVGSLTVSIYISATVKALSHDISKPQPIFTSSHHLFRVLAGIFIIVLVSYVNNILDLKINPLYIAGAILFALFVHSYLVHIILAIRDKAYTRSIIDSYHLLFLSYLAMFSIVVSASYNVMIAVYFIHHVSHFFGADKI